MNRAGGNFKDGYSIRGIIKHQNPRYKDEAETQTDREDILS